MKTCKRCFRESEADVVDISPATELTDYVDSHFHGNDKEGCGNDRGEADEDINDLCPRCREELGVMDLLGFGL